MKLKVFSPKEWQKYKDKQREKFELELQAARTDAYNKGYERGVKNTEDILAAVVYHFGSQREEFAENRAAVTIEIQKSLIGAIHYIGALHKGAITEVKVVVKNMLP